MNHPLRLYDTMSRQKRDFVPLAAPKVGLYVCGMTVYDYCHLGHARVMIAFDVLYRWLKESGYEVSYVRNITDVDDKIIKRAVENGESIQALTERFIDAMHEDAASLYCQSPTAEPKATEHMTQMHQMIGQLLEQGFAYESAGDVYFAVDKFEGYGKLSGRCLDDMLAGASDRGVDSSRKQNPFDFVLWKGVSDDSAAWASPFGSGRPGWHIECSAMSTHCLGTSFDIHGGGHDLQFPHHENEIAQSEAVSGATYAQNWMHVGFVNVDGEKMSKSLGNFFTIRDLLEIHDAEVLRFALVSSHYRSPISFSEDLLAESHSALSRLYTALKGFDAAELVDADLDGGLVSEFSAAMNDDLATPQALSVLFKAAKSANQLATNDRPAALTQAATLKYLASFLGLLNRDTEGFFKGSFDDQGMSSDAIEQLIEERAVAKRDKNFARADEIRQELLERQVVLEDSSNGTTWRREAP